ncbi:methylenetetrahydrofolate reductase [Fructobacillus sp. CRL 2054]|uniref:methylenetetrahydrofolate reductase n=1 Tax=Fructobacillus sp. CRL 2054 TaxID=2763007 RepID=UPI0023783EDF|nr:methylenetetrahydrofolate reductase [Fructobacillus sp. CRL 2054]
MIQKISDFYIDSKQTIFSNELTKKKIEEILANGFTEGQEKFSYFSLVNQGDSQADFDELLLLAKAFQARKKYPVLVHLRLGDVTPDSLPRFIEKTRQLGLMNFLVLSGDKRVNKQGFSTVESLLSALKKGAGNSLTLAATVNPSDSQAVEKVKRRKQAGADFFISQILFASQPMVDLKAALVQAGLTVQLVAGMLNQPTVGQVRWVGKTFGLTVPAAYLKDPIKVNQTVEKSLQEAGFSAFHFFTLPNF